MIDNLECLSDVQVAEKLFLIQGDKPQLMNWKEYGLRIGVQEESLSSSERVEAAVVALVGEQFQFPPNTVLVSAHVYAVSLSKPLLKSVRLEIQHSIDLTRRPDLSHCFKFAIAPMSTPSLPYQFSIVEGGEFSCNDGYGSIQHKIFSCLVCILREDSTNGGGNGVPIASDNGDTVEGEEEEEEHQPQQEENEEEEEGEQQLQHEEEGIKQQQQQVAEKEDNEVVQQELEEEEEQPQDEKEEEEEEESEYQKEEQDEEGDKEGGDDDDDSDSDNTSSTGPGASGAACKG